VDCRPGHHRTRIYRWPLLRFCSSTTASQEGVADSSCPGNY
jgi:hypothetical protein